MDIESFVKNKCVEMFSMSTLKVHEQGAVIANLTMNIYKKTHSTLIV